MAAGPDAPEALDADFVIVGAGSAGCVLANRLSADPSVRVVLLEAGGDDRLLHNAAQFMTNLNISIPAGFANLLKDPKVIWDYEGEPEPMLGGRRYHAPRGRVLGGSSALNGMLYVRGLPADYDGWRQLGCTGWSFEDVLPVFRRLENVARSAEGAAGAGGPLSVDVHPVQMAPDRRFIEACGEVGIPPIDTINGPVQEGVCYTQQTTRRGRRHSTAAAFLHPVRRRRNLQVVTGALAARILFAGRRAVGVEYRKDGRLMRVNAAREVVLSGGAVNSPQLLELSGVGDGARLSALGIDTVAHSPRVGEGLQDHLTVSTLWRLKPGTPSFNRLSRGMGLAGQMLRYGLTGGGLLGGAAAPLTGFVRTRPELDLPDAQIFATSATADFEATEKSKHVVLETEPGFTVAGNQCRPQSRGSVHIVSPEPDAHPKIFPNFLSAPADQAVAMDMVRLFRRIMRQPAVSSIVERSLYPSEELADDDREGLMKFVGAIGGTTYHLSCSCGMGGQGSVVDPELKVRGVERLRVADASVMPQITSGNTNAPSIMIGMKAADMILA